jgi:catechol 2,3-dioxygenase-like lactoylglutathione lyase family enzyme
MRQHLGFVALLVRDYDEAIRYFTQVLGFDLISDTPLNEEEKGKRWVLVAPPGSHEARILLMKAITPQQYARIGDQTGGRVFLFLHTDDFYRDYETFRKRGVAFTELPRQEEYGVVAVFEDFLGNKWDLLQLKPGAVG